MARFLTTSGTTYHLEQLINNAHDRLYIISPFMKTNPRIRALLEDKDRMKIDLRVIFGKEDLSPQEMSWLRSLKTVRAYFLKDLHAKCYLNEREAIITSMNLYDFSQVNNNEMGVYFTKDEDPELYNDALAEAQRLIRTGDGDFPVGGPSEPAKDGSRSSAKKQAVPQKSPPGVRDVMNAFKVAFTGGRCIRCQKQIDYNPDKPLCEDCFKVWNRYQDPDFAESHCHRCGRDTATSYAKPLCYSCYQAVK